MSKFGKKTLELFEIMDNTPDWTKYVTDKTAKIITVLRESESIKDTREFFADSNGKPMEYITVRSHILKAIDRISTKNTDFKRGGKSELAQELFNLMDSTPNWEDLVTNYEAELAKKFREIRNFYKMGKELNLGPGNIAGTLYGTKQKLGVIGKIKEGIPQAERRDFSVLSEDQSIEEYVEEVNNDEDKAE